MSCMILCSSQHKLWFFTNFNANLSHLLINIYKYIYQNFNLQTMSNAEPNHDKNKDNSQEQQQDENDLLLFVSICELLNDY